VIANGEAINVLRAAAVSDEQLVPVSGGERIPLFTRKVRDAAAAGHGDVKLEDGPPGAPPRPSTDLAVASVHVWPSLHCLMPGRSHADIPDVMNTGKVSQWALYYPSLPLSHAPNTTPALPHFILAQHKLTTGAPLAPPFPQEYIGGTSQYACTLDITFGMKHGLLRISDHIPESAMDAGMRSFATYISGPARSCMSAFDGGQLAFNFLLGSPAKPKTLMWSAHLGAYSGLLQSLEPKPDILIQAIAGRANLNGRPYDGSAAGFATEVCRWLGQPERVIWCLHDDAPIKPWSVDVRAATEMVERETRGRVVNVVPGEVRVLWEE
jgi:hypothetical protein